MSDDSEVVAALEWILREIESKEPHVDTEKVNEGQHFYWSNIKTILVEEKPLTPNAPAKVKEVYKEREEVQVEGATTSLKEIEMYAEREEEQVHEAVTSIKTEDEPDKVNKTQSCDWGNRQTVLIEEKSLKAEAHVKAKDVCEEAEDTSTTDIPVEGAETSTQAEELESCNGRLAEKFLIEEKPLKADAPAKAKDVESIKYVEAEDTNTADMPVEGAQTLTKPKEIDFLNNKANRFLIEDQTFIPLALAPLEALTVECFKTKRFKTKQTIRKLHSRNRRVSDINAKKETATTKPSFFGSMWRKMVRCFQRKK